MNPLRGAAPALCLALAACSLGGPVTRTASVFSSSVVLTLNDHASDAAFEACFSRLREIDAEMNMWEPSSELARLNARSGQGAIPVSRDLAEAAAGGLELARLSGGIFDPSVGPLVRLWGIGTPKPALPSDARIRERMRLVGWRRVALDSSAPSIALEAGMELDYGALAKGYGAREAGRLLASLGVKSALLDVGGCVLVLGSDAHGRPWKIGVQAPGSARGTPLGYFSLRDSVVDTSGTYERYFEAGGRRYAHIMDTRTGRPVDGPILSSTVALPRERNADGPPLAFLVLGAGEGIALADSLGMPALLIAEGHRLYLSKAAASVFTLLDTGYSIEKLPHK